MSHLSGAYFEVDLISATGVALLGNFLSVSGLDMEFEYEVFAEGGSNYPRFFYKNVKPQTLVLERGTVSSDILDAASALAGEVNQGMSAPMSGLIRLKDSFGNTKRVWSVVGAHLVRYVGPKLDSNQPSLAVSRIELMHNGCY